MKQTRKLFQLTIACLLMFLAFITPTNAFFAQELNSASFSQTSAATGNPLVAALKKLVQRAMGHANKVSETEQAVGSMVNLIPKETAILSLADDASVVTMIELLKPFKNNYRKLQKIAFRQGDEVVAGDMKKASEEMTTFLRMLQDQVDSIAR